MTDAPGVFELFNLSVTYRNRFSVNDDLIVQPKTRDEETGDFVLKQLEWPERIKHKRLRDIVLSADCRSSNLKKNGTISIEGLDAVGRGGQQSKTFCMSEVETCMDGWRLWVRMDMESLQSIIKNIKFCKYPDCIVRFRGPVFHDDFETKKSIASKEKDVILEYFEVTDSADWNLNLQTRRDRRIEQAEPDEKNPGSYWHHSEQWYHNLSNHERYTVDEIGKIKRTLEETKTSQAHSLHTIMYGIFVIGILIAFVGVS